jgi:sporulation protein YlmC with PRC-barrel domain
MKTKILTAASAIALLAAMPALAEDPARNNANTNNTLQEDASKAWENTKKDTSEAAESVSEATKETYRDIKAAVLGDESDTGDKFDYVTINQKQTASSLIGQPVVNGAKERVGTVKDIILDANGKASLIVVSDGEWITTGQKLAAFDYDSIISRNADGDVVMPLTEETMTNVAAFSYDAKDADEKTRVIPANGYSVAEIMEGDVVDAEKKSVASVDDVTISNGQAQELVIGFDKILGLGGKKAVVDYDNVKMVSNADKTDLDFQLTAKQAAQFESYKKTATN